MLFNIGDWSLCAALAAVLWFGVTTVASTASTGGAQLWVAAASALLSFGGLVVYLPTMRGPYVLLRTLATSGRDDAELSIVDDVSAAGSGPASAIQHGPTLRRSPKPKLQAPNAYPPAFPNGWFFLAGSGELARGKTLYVRVLRQHIALFRGSDGVVRALDAFCPHNGANLAVGGIVKGNCLECPFHGWTFDGKGTCVSVPYSAAPPKPDFATTKVHHVVERNRMILLWFHAEGAEPTYEVPVMPCLSVDSNWVLQARAVHYVAAHIQELPENGADLHHFAPLHGSPVVDFLVPLGFRHEWKGTWAGVTTAGAIEGARGAEGPIVDAQVIQSMSCRGLRVPFTHTEVNLQQIGPGVVQFVFNTPFGQVAVQETVTPIEPLLQRVTHHMYANPWIPNFLVRGVFKGMMTQYERDAFIFNHKKFLSAPKLVKEDALVQRYRTWFAQFYSPSSRAAAADSTGCSPWDW